jgi:hypothetical protein
MKTEIEYVAYHRVKRVFIPITDIESENPEDIEVYEFEGQNFKLTASIPNPAFMSLSTTNSPPTREIS